MTTAQTPMSGIDYRDRIVGKIEHLGESHAAGSHDEHPYSGCLACLLEEMPTDGCLLSGALETEVVGE